MRSASAPAYRIPVEAKRQAVALLQQYEGGHGVHLADPLLTSTVHFIAFESGRQTPDVLAILQQIPGSRVPESTKPGNFETSMQNRRRAMEKNPTLPWHYGKCSPDCPPGCQGKTSKRARSAVAGGAEGPPSTRPALVADGVVASSADLGYPPLAMGAAASAASGAAHADIFGEAQTGATQQLEEHDAFVAQQFHIEGLLQQSRVASSVVNGSPEEQQSSSTTILNLVPQVVQC